MLAFESHATENFQMTLKRYHRDRFLSEEQYHTLATDKAMIFCHGIGPRAVENECTKFVNCKNGIGVMEECGPKTVFHKVFI